MTTILDRAGSGAVSPLLAARLPLTPKTAPAGRPDDAPPLAHFEGNHAHVKYIETQIMPSLGTAEVRIIAHTPEAARAVAEALRRCFAGAEQRSYPALDGNTRLHLTVDTATPAGPVRSWLAASRTPAGSGVHSDET